jgi:hypothetical protein
MRKKIQHLASISFFFLLMLFTVSAAAQTTPQTQDQKVENLKVLYQEMSNTTVSTAFIKGMLETSQDNLTIWKNVKQHHADNNAKDMTYLDQVIQGMEAKLGDRR